MNKKALNASINNANKNFAKRSRFTVKEFKQILDHVVNAEFVERLFLHKEIPALTKVDMDKLVANKLKLEMDMTPASSLLHEVLGGYDGTNIDSASYVVAMWGPEQLARL